MSGLQDHASAVVRWQAVFDSHAALFADLAPGSRMGLVSKSSVSLPAGKRLAGLRAAAPADGASMLAFEARSGAIRVNAVPFRGFEPGHVDVLFVADDATLSELDALPQAAVLRAMKQRLREGTMMFYVFRTKHELADAGYEDFLDSLGLAFLGACR